DRGQQARRRRRPARRHLPRRRALARATSRVGGGRRGRRRRGEGRRPDGERPDGERPDGGLMDFLSLAIPDVVLVTPRVHRDERGFFLERYRQEAFAAAGLPTTFVQ